MLKYNLVDAKDCFDYGDDNLGFIYGIEWLDENEEIIEVEWYETKRERLKALRIGMRV